MNLVIDTRYGIAGDIVVAGLIGLGADKMRVFSSMERVAEIPGGVKIEHIVDDGVNRVFVDIKYDYSHLHEEQARKMLEDTLGILEIKPEYKAPAVKILDVLCEAERYVHSHHPRLKTMEHGGESEKGAVLHEVKDIVVDIAGVVCGMESLGVEEVFYLGYVNVGGGKVSFSHGEFDVPAPAVRYILDRYSFVWKNSDIPLEAATPTGVSILAGLGAERLKEFVYVSARKSLAGGTRTLPPVPFYLTP